MSKPSNHVEYRGWRIRVETTLGFLTLELIVSSMVLSGLAIAAPRFQGLLIGALVIIVIGLAALVSYLAICHQGALLDTRYEMRNRNSSSKKRSSSEPGSQE
jgi:hypothetical protein